MRERGDAPLQLSQSNFKHAYWTLAQLLTHHASNGCNLQDGGRLILRAHCQRTGAARIGFGDCAGVVVAAPA